MSRSDLASNSSNTTPLSRANPYATGARPSRASARLLEGWLREVKQSDWRPSHEMRLLLETLAQGYADPDGKERAQSLFNELIRFELFGVFVSAFSTYNALMQAHAEAEGKPFKPSLTLALPQGWAPRDPDAMHEAFRQIRVQRVELFWSEAYFDTPPDENASFTEEIGLDFRPPRPEWSAPISGAICEGVAVLLAGATELAVCGVLANADVIVQAMENAERLQALDLGKPRKTELSDAEKDCYCTLLSSKKARSKLQQVTLCQADVLGKLHERHGSMLEWPALQSLAVDGCGYAHERFITDLLKTAARSPGLTSVLLSFVGRAPEGIDRMLAALKSHPSLSRLSLRGPYSAFNSNAFQLDAICSGIEVAHTCPSLRYLHWDTGFAYRVANFTNWSLYLTASHLERLKVALEDPKFPLWSLVMNGVNLPEAVLEILFGALGHNLLLEYLDLSGSVVDEDSLNTLLAALTENRVARDIVLPQRLVKGRAGAQIQALLAQIRRERQQPNAHAELAADVGQIMAMAAVQRGIDTEKAQGFKDIAAGVVQALEAQGTLRTAVQVSRVSAMVDDKGARRPPASQRHPDVKPYVRQHNKDAVAQDLPEAPLLVNEVDEQGSNNPLSDAVWVHGSPVEVSKALSEKAIDFGARVQRSVPHGPLRDAFLPVNEVDGEGRNVRLKEVVLNNDLRGLRRLLLRGAMDIGGGVERDAPEGPLKTLLSVNRVDRSGVNEALGVAVENNDPAAVLRRRAQGAIDFGGRVLNSVPKSNRALRAAFAKAAVPTTTTTAGTSATTTTTTTTGTTGTTVPRPLRTRGPRADQDKPKG